MVASQNGWVKKDPEYCDPDYGEGWAALARPTNNRKVKGLGVKGFGKQWKKLTVWKLKGLGKRWTKEKVLGLWV